MVGGWRSVGDLMGIEVIIFFFYNYLIYYQCFSTQTHQVQQKEWQNVVIAYEPVWAIGTGKVLIIFYCFSIFILIFPNFHYNLILVSYLYVLEME